MTYRLSTSQENKRRQLLRHKELGAVITAALYDIPVLADQIVDVTPYSSFQQAASTTSFYFYKYGAVYDSAHLVQIGRYRSQLSIGKSTVCLSTNTIDISDRKIYLFRFPMYEDKSARSPPKTVSSLRRFFGILNCYQICSLRWRWQNTSWRINKMAKNQNQLNINYKQFKICKSSFPKSAFLARHHPPRIEAVA